MKTLITLLLFISSSAFASGKLTVQPNYWFTKKMVTPVVGLAIYEPIWKGHIAYNSWTGFGDQPLIGKDNVLWVSTKQDIEFYLWRITIAPGIQVNYLPESQEFLPNVHVKVAAQLW